MSNKTSVNSHEENESTQSDTTQNDEVVEYEAKRLDDDEFSAKTNYIPMETESEEVKIPTKWIEQTDQLQTTDVRVTEYEEPTFSASRQRQSLQLTSAPQTMEGLTRIIGELKDIQKNPPPNCTARAYKNDVLHWIATILGPENTIYEGGRFALDIRFTDEYPFRPPHIRFSTRIYHCNIDSNGIICLDILDEKWSPVLTISKVLLSIFILLGNCNPDDPLVVCIAEQYQKRRIEHDKIARQWVHKYAMPTIRKQAKQLDRHQQQEYPSSDEN